MSLRLKRSLSNLRRGSLSSSQTLPSTHEVLCETIIEPAPTGDIPYASPSISIFCDVSRVRRTASDQLNSETDATLASLRQTIKERLLLHCAAVKKLGPDSDVSKIGLGQFTQSVIDILTSNGIQASQRPTARDRVEILMHDWPFDAEDNLSRKTKTGWEFRCQDFDADTQFQKEHQEEITQMLASLKIEIDTKVAAETASKATEASRRDSPRDLIPRR